jgi:hypothetical protein
MYRRGQSDVKMDDREAHFGMYQLYDDHQEEMGVADICPYLLLLFLNALANQRPS